MESRNAVVNTSGHTLPLRGDYDECDSNFTQLLRLRGADHQGIDSWLNKKTNKYTSPDS